MADLPDMFVPCDVCHGERYNREPLPGAVQGLVDRRGTGYDYGRGRGVLRRAPSDQAQTGDLASRSAWATSRSASRPPPSRAVKPSVPAGLGCPSAPPFALLTSWTSLVGLHAADVHKLMDVLQRLPDAGNTVLIIEHNPGHHQGRGLPDRPRPGGRSRARSYAGEPRKRSAKFRDLTPGSSAAVLLVPRTDATLPARTGSGPDRTIGSFLDCLQSILVSLKLFHGFLFFRSNELLRVRMSQQDQDQAAVLRDPSAPLNKAGMVGSPKRVGAPDLRPVFP